MGADSLGALDAGGGGNENPLKEGPLPLDDTTGGDVGPDSRRSPCVGRCILKAGGGARAGAAVAFDDPMGAWSGIGHFSL